MSTPRRPAPRSSVAPITATSRTASSTLTAGRRTRAAADLRPAAARLLPDPLIPDESVPAVLATARPCAVAGSQRDPASDAESRFRPVVAGGGPDAGDPAAVEPHLHRPAVEFVAELRLLAVLTHHARLRTAETYVPNPMPRNEHGRIGVLAARAAAARPGGDRGQRR